MKDTKNHLTKVKRGRGEVAYGVFNYIFFTVLCIVMVYPFWHVVMMSRGIMPENQYLCGFLAFCMAIYPNKYPNVIFLVRTHCGGIALQSYRRKLRCICKLAVRCWENT